MTDTPDIPEPWLDAAAAVGGLIEYWGFKHIHGVLWTLLYLHGAPGNQASLCTWTGYSRGAVSMALQELEAWGVVRSERPVASRELRYRAVTDLAGMIRTVLERRELPLLRDAGTRFAAAARQSREYPEAAARLRTLAGLSEAGAWTVDTFVRRGEFPWTRLRRYFDRGLDGLRSLTERVAR
jgi:hypothetical protein